MKRKFQKGLAEMQDWQLPPEYYVCPLAVKKGAADQLLPAEPQLLGR